MTDVTDVKREPTDEEYTANSVAKDVFLKYLRELSESETPLTYLCKDYNEPMLMSKSKTLYAANFELLVNGAVEAFDDSSEILADIGAAPSGVAPSKDKGTQQQQQEQQEQPQDQEQQQQEQEQPQEIQLQQYERPYKDEQKMKILAEAYQYFVNIDHVSIGKDTTLTMLDKVEQVSKNGFRTKSLKAQYDALMLLPLFLAHRF